MGLSLRHSRQSRLAEVGEAGQARIARATVVVRDAGEGGASEIEARYLAGAGVGRLVVAGAPIAAAARAIDARVEVAIADAGGAAAYVVEAAPPDFGLTDPAAAAVAIGAWRALAALRAIVRDAGGAIAAEEAT